MCSFQLCTYYVKYMIKSVFSSQISWAFLLDLLLKPFWDYLTRFGENDDHFGHEPNIQVSRIMRNQGQNGTRTTIVVLTNLSQLWREIVGILWRFKLNLQIHAQWFVVGRPAWRQVMILFPRKNVSTRYRAPDEHGTTTGQDLDANWRWAMTKKRSEHSLRLGRASGRTSQNFILQKQFESKLTFVCPMIPGLHLWKL